MSQNPVQEQLLFYLHNSVIRVRGEANFYPSSQNSKPDFNVTSPCDMSIWENALKYDTIVLALTAVCFQSEVRQS